jgi:hypothetical protein
VVKVKDKIRATLPEALHDDLHWARNQFLHGMPIRPTMPRYRQSNHYNPTMSRILSMSSGSFDSLKVSLRWGCRPNARQMRLTDDRLIPLVSTWNQAVIFPPSITARRGGCVIKKFREATEADAAGVTLGWQLRCALSERARL